MRTFLFWLLALVITTASAVYQRKTGPTYPLEGEVRIAETVVRYNLERSHGGPDNHIVTVQAKNPDIHGTLAFKRYKTDDPWTKTEMLRSGANLKGVLPHQPPAGKLQYYITLSAKEQKVQIPEEGPVTIRFKGNVPSWALIPHIIFMFAAMLFSTRTGIEAIRKNKNPQKLVFWTIGLLFIGGFIFGPIVQKYAFDAFWTGFPFGYDLTDNKTLIALLAWIIALFAGKKTKKTNNWYIAASIVTLIIFLIPHSLLGSELDYSQMTNN